MAKVSLVSEAPPTDRQRGWMWRVRVFLRFTGRTATCAVAFSLLLGCILAMLLRLVWKDSLPALAPLFYATPLALIWSGLATASGLFFFLRKPAWAMTTAVVAIACWSQWQRENIVDAPPVSSDKSMQVVFWNTARLKFGWDSVARQIQTRSAPLMGFVEAGPDDSESRTRWQRDFPDHQPIFFGNGMALLTQGTILETSQGVLGRGSYYGRAVLEWNADRVTVFLVDIHSNPFFSRKETLARLTELTTGTLGPVIIMGDFNTPSDSVHFAALRASFQNVFEARGQGQLATWPVPCPVLAIDHIWTNREIAIDCARHEWSIQSDHQAVIAELTLSEQSSQIASLLANPE